MFKFYLLLSTLLVTELYACDSDDEHERIADQKRRIEQELQHQTRLQEIQQRYEQRIQLIQENAQKIEQQVKQQEEKLGQERKQREEEEINYQQEQKIKFQQIQENLDHKLEQIRLRTEQQLKQDEEKHKQNIEQHEEVTFRYQSLMQPHILEIIAEHIVDDVNGTEFCYGSKPRTYSLNSQMVFDAFKKYNFSMNAAEFTKAEEKYAQAIYRWKNVLLNYRLTSGHVARWTAQRAGAKRPKFTDFIRLPFDPNNLAI